MSYGHHRDATDYAGAACLAALAIGVLALAALLCFLLARYTLHPDRYRDVHYQITRTIYVIARRQK